ncbi:carboxypeptidase B-like [Mya arenaria]|uniref:carboxypeptidase B-like n=1 Tax=Mya arenaria TaxID=6604 RepID=UPI0022E72342|nr:carboxypeptidase B-like [Mya arenaria]
MLFPAICVTLLPLALAFPSHTKVKYDGHKVLEILHDTKANFRKLQEMELKFDLDIWKSAKHVNDTMHVRVPPQHLDAFLGNLRDMNVQVSTLIEDVEELLQGSAHSMDHRRAIFSGDSGYDHTAYHGYEYIMKFLEFVQNDAKKSADVSAELFTIGQSYENRNLTGIRIFSTVPGVRKKIFIDGAIHAREWISPAAINYLIDKLVYTAPADIIVLLARYEIYLIPVLNPDGYEFSHTNTRMWRKNRNPRMSASCPGVDLNRNFPHQWNPAIGGSTNPCTDTYSGNNAASEPETQALVTYLKANDFFAYLTVHSYGQFWLFPWGYTSEYPTDRYELETAANAGTNAMNRETRRKWIVGSSTNALYAAAGGSDDFAKGDANIKYSYTLELPDAGRYGFLLPATEIVDVGNELLIGLIAFANHLHLNDVVG